MNIRRLAPLSFFALALVLPACGGAADSGAFFDWGIVDVGAPDSAPFLSCEESGGGTVVLEAQDLSRGGAPQTFSYPCKAGGGNVPGLPSGQYSMTVRLLRSSDNVAVSSLPLGTVSIARRGQTDLGVVVFEIQSLTVNWLIKQAANLSTPVTCAAVGATQVELTATAATQAPNIFRFPCVDGQGQTQAVTVGAYTISTRLLNAAGTALPGSEQSLDFVTPNNTPAVLPLVTFTVN
jgi:hypothetical protein